MKPVDGKPWDARLAFLLVYPLRDTALTPNHLTTLRLLFGVLACAAFAAGGYGWSNAGAICFVISNFLDHTDGELARIAGKSSRAGHYYDLVSDALVNILLFGGIGIGLAGGPLGPLAVPLGCLSGISVAAIFHMRNVIEQAVGKSDARQPHAGGFEAEDILYALPLVTLGEQLTAFLLLASVGAPLFACWVLREYLRIRTTAIP
ncbi:MAG: CDP-alcohol phosphatidyltransferase family protein [Gammaproteobacteria bacterium]|nr:CDP-alcohol phosphatidyltransferase family protein [Gammaproteobacteria bacterium]